MNKPLLPLLSSLALILIVLGCASQRKEPNSADLYPSADAKVKYHNNWTENHYRQRIAAFREDPLEVGDIVLVGNSITEQGRDWSEKFGVAHVRNRGIAGDVTDGVLARLDELVYYKPRAVFLLIGINDLFNYHHEAHGRPDLLYEHTIPSPTYVGENIVNIAQTLHKRLPETRTFVCTVLPTRRDFLKVDILKVNQILQEQEAANPYELIDLHAAFVDENGDMEESLTRDGVHLTPAGYQRWVEVVQPIIKAL